MDMSPFVSSDPAIRADGWSPARKLRFLDRLAACGNVRAACAAVGMSRDAAYVLRRRDALFARGWNAARMLARESCVEVLADKAIEGIEEEVWYRGEMRGTRRRFDARLLLAHIARLDRMAEEADDSASADAERFDTILAVIAGEEVPEALRDELDPLPIPRECAVDDAEHEVRARVNESWAGRASASEDETPDEEAYAEHESELEEAVANARAEAAAGWDAWFRDACASVDAVLERTAAEAAVPACGGSPAPVEARAEPPADPSAERQAAAAPSPEPTPAAQPSDPTPGTVSEVSASATCATFAGPDGRRYARA